MKKVSKKEMKGKQWYWFRVVKDDGRSYDFQGRFPDAFKADRWAMKCFHLWMTGVISYRIIFYC